MAEVGRELVAEHDRVRLVEPTSEVRVRADPDALRRLMRNLVENALVHGPPDGEVTIAVAAADGFAVIAVADEGVGPDPAHRELLFRRFWRGPEAAGRPGSGLGLSIVAAIAERHGGRVHVEGATFVVELPAS